MNVHLAPPEGSAHSLLDAGLRKTESTARNSPEIFFSFRSIVIIGASEDERRIGGSILFLLKKYGYDGKIYGLNPKYTEVQGVPCFARAEDLPDSVDIAVFSVGAANLPQILPTLQRKGLKGAVIYSAGFREAGEDGKALQKWLSDYSADNKIAILGPNCAGMISVAAQRPLTFSNVVVALPRLQPGRIALICQSAGVAVNLLADAVTSGVRFSHMVTTGNEADCGVAEFLNYMADDDSTDVVVAYLEGLNDGPAFCEAAARLQSRKKPLIVIKVGTSSTGRDAVSSHTGQLSSDDSGFQALFERYGAIRVSTLQELNDYARVFSIPGMKPKLTVATTSGGSGVYVSDICEELGIPLSNLSAKTEAGLAEFVPSFGRVRNPVDVTAHVNNDISLIEKSLRVLLDDPDTGIMVFLLLGKATPEASQEAIDLFKRVQSSTEKTLIICWMGAPEEVRTRASAAGLIVFSDPARFLYPLRDYLRLAAERDQPSPAVLPRQDAATALPPIASDRVRGLLVSGPDNALLLPERQSMQLLDETGVDCPARAYARSAADIEAIARTTIFPVVMKLVEPVLAHKSDVGGVTLGIADPVSLMAAWERMAKDLGAREVMVAEQVRGDAELIVGCQRDSTFGMRLTIGSGGIWTNRIKDTVTLIPPFDEAYVRAALPRLLIGGALLGERGQPPLAVDALVRSICGVARLAVALSGDIREFECNPVIVSRDRAVVVDAIGFSLACQGKNE